MAIDRDNWTVPSSSKREARRGRVPGALGGSLLYEQPRHAALKAEIGAFVAPGPPLAVEVGFDHGITLLANARCFPAWRWLGVELRRKRVAAVREVADETLTNCLPLRIDARTLFAGLLPEGRVHRVDILFPTPVVKGHHLLVTEGFVADVRRALAPDGVVFIMTDVAALDAWMADCFAGWREVEPPPRAPDLSRRERVCRRDGLPIWSRTLSPPVPPQLTGEETFKGA